MFRRRSPFFRIVSICAIDIAVLLLSSTIVLAVTVPSQPEVTTSLWGILLALAERNLAALAIGILAGIYLVLWQFKLLERLDKMDDNQRRLARYIKAICDRAHIDLPDSGILEGVDE